MTRASAAPVGQSAPAVPAAQLAPAARRAPAAPPSHLRDCPADERFGVSQDVQARYPPVVLKGWKGGCSWVVVIRGRDIGVFYDFW